MPKNPRPYPTPYTPHPFLEPGPELVRSLAGGGALVLLAQVGAAAVGAVAAVGPEVALAGDHPGVARALEVAVAAVVVVVGADVAGELGPLPLVVVRLDDRLLHHLPAGAVDRVGDVGVEFGPAVVVAGGPVLVQVGAAVVAIARPQVVLGPAPWAPVGQLAAGHGHEEALGALNDLQ